MKDALLGGGLESGDWPRGCSSEQGSCASLTRGRHSFLIRMKSKSSCLAKRMCCEEVGGVAEWMGGLDSE